MRVIATMRDIDRCGPLEEAADARGVSVNVEQLDVTAASAGDKIREFVLKYGPLYGLVNNAGVAVGGPFEEQSERDVREQFETNVFGLMAVTRAALPSMRVTGRGRIVNISSISGRVAPPILSIYAATKHAVEGFSESLRWELEPFGIDVVLVEPGTFKTPIFEANRRLAEHLDREGPYGPMIAAIEGIILDSVGKAPPPDEVGRTVAGLLRHGSPDALPPAFLKPPFRNVVGREALFSDFMHRFIPDRLFAAGMRRLLRKPPLR